MTEGGMWNNGRWSWWTSSWMQEVRLWMILEAGRGLTRTQRGFMGWASIWYVFFAFSLAYYNPSSTVRVKIPGRSATFTERQKLRVSLHCRQHR
jgi:hypothetical protein